MSRRSRHPKKLCVNRIKDILEVKNQDRKCLETERMFCYEKRTKRITKRVCGEPEFHEYSRYYGRNEGTV